MRLTFTFFSHFIFTEVYYTSIKSCWKKKKRSDFCSTLISRFNSGFSSRFSFRLRQPRLWSISATSLFFSWIFVFIILSLRNHFCNRLYNLWKHCLESDSLFYQSQHLAKFFFIIYQKNWINSLRNFSQILYFFFIFDL